MENQKVYIYQEYKSSMLWPFKTREKQRKFAIIMTFMGVFILMLNTSVKIPFLTLSISTYYVGLFIGLLGLMYLAEAAASWE